MPGPSAPPTALTQVAHCTHTGCPLDSPRLPAALTQPPTALTQVAHWSHPGCPLDSPLRYYNLGVAGVKEYRDEYQTGLVKTKKISDDAGATLVMLGTTPAHNVGTTNSSDVTVQALNAAAQALAKEAGIQFVDLYTPLIAKCGPVPWADTGANACALCAPNCKKLSVHYGQAGYEAIADLIWGAVGPGHSG